MSAASPELTRIVGTVIELHPKSGDNWSRAKLQFTDGRTSWVTAKFKMEQGETLEADCTYNDKYRSYDVVKLAAGEDGKVSNAVVILKLVEILDGVGAVKARRLGEQFPDLFEILTTSPEKIVEACGADLQDVKNVADGLAGEKAELSRVSTLVNKGWPHHLAKRVAKNDKAYKTALESPYAAIKFVSGLGWLLADEIGRKLGIKLDDPKRIEAGIDHFYREKVAGDGHTIVHEDDLLGVEALPALLGVKVDKIVSKVDSVLLPRGDGWYTSKQHLDNAQTIAGFFLRTPAKVG